MITKVYIKSALTEAGISGVVATKRIADALHLSVRTINNAKNRGHLKAADRNAFDVDAIVEWLYAHPRYLTRIN